MNTSILHSFNEITKQEWEELWEKVPNANIFQTWSWYSCWEKKFGASGCIRIIVLRANNELIAAVPLYIHEQKVGPIKGKVLSFVSSRSSAYPLNQGPLIIPEITHEVIGLIAGIIASMKEYDIISIDCIERNRLADKLLEEIGKHMNICVLYRNCGTSHVVKFNSTYEKFISSLGSSTRKNIRKVSNKFFSDKKNQLKIVESQEELDLLLNSLVNQKKERFRSKGLVSSFDDDRFNAFIKEICSSFLTEGRLIGLMAKIGEQIAATSIVFIDGHGHSYAYSSSFEPDYEELRLHYLLESDRVRRIIDLGYKEIDLSTGFGQHKDHWAKGDQRDLFEGVIIKRRIKKIYYQVACKIKERLKHQINKIKKSAYILMNNEVPTVKFKENKIKILFVIDKIHEGAGGTETQLLRLIDSLDKERFQVSLLVFKDSPWYKRIPEKSKKETTLIPVYTFKKIGTYFNLLKMVYFVRRMKPDIVHTFFPIANIVGVLAAWIAGVKKIVSSRRDYGEWITPGLMLFTRIANLFVTKIVSNSYVVRDLTMDLEKVRREKIEVIYNGLDLDSFMKRVDSYKKADIREELNIPPDRKIIGTVANLRPMKRLNTLLYAVHEVVNTFSNVCVIIVGTGTEDGKLRDLAKELGLQDAAIFLGRQYDVTKYLSIFDIAVNCSEKEGLSNAIMEYLTAGIPVIASKSGGNEELIQDGVNGFTFPVGDYKTLADKILILLNNEVYRTQFMKTRDEMLAKVSIERMAENFGCFYEGLYKESHVLPLE